MVLIGNSAKILRVREYVTPPAQLKRPNAAQQTVPYQRIISPCNLQAPSSLLAHDDHCAALRDIQHLLKSNLFKSLR